MMKYFFLAAFGFNVFAMNQEIDLATKIKIADALCEYVWAIPKQKGKTRVTKGQLKIFFQYGEMQRLVNGLIKVDNDNERYLIKPNIGIVQVFSLAQEHVSSK